MRFERIAPSTRFSFITTVCGFGAVTDAMLVARNGSSVLTFGSLNRLSENATSSAVTGEPSENFASRRWKTIVLPPFENSHDFARPGCGVEGARLVLDELVVDHHDRPDRPVVGGAERAERHGLEVARELEHAAALRRRRGRRGGDAASPRPQAESSAPAAGQREPERRAPCGRRCGGRPGRRAVRPAGCRADPSVPSFASLAVRASPRRLVTRSRPSSRRSS